MTQIPRLVAVLLVVLTLFGAACSGDDGDTAADQPGADTVPDDGGTPLPDIELDADCPDQGFVGEISRIADGGHTDAEISTDDVLVDGVVAARLSEGSFYTVYVADHEYVGDPREFETVEAAPGGVVATLSFGREAGYLQDESFARGDEGTTVAVVVDSGGGARTSSMNAEGTVTPLGWDDDVVCFRVDYRDDVQTVVGTVSAEVVAGF